jgi:hypothetical protein
VDPWGALGYGAFGGFLVESLAFVAAIQQGGRWPWKIKGKPRLGPYLTAVVVRLLAGGGLAFTLAESGQVSGPVAAAAVGIATPVIVEKLGQRAAVALGADDPVAISATNANAAVTKASTQNTRKQSSGGANRAVAPSEPGAKRPDRSDVTSES